MTGVSNQIYPEIQGNLETFLLFWLDAQIKITDDNRKTKKKLRSIINHLKTFDDPIQCQQLIESLSEEDRLVLIVSGRLGQQIVPQIHQLRQVASIYVYCMNQQLNEEWTKDFTKVKGVIVELDDLLAQVKLDVQIRVKIEEPISFNIYIIKEYPVQSTTKLNDHFIHSILLINALLRLKSLPKDKQKLLALCKKEYEDNDSQLHMIKEFKHEYTSDKALWWYTRESFLYRMLSKALRLQNIDLLLLFRFVISDIYQQLKENRCMSPIRVYRGQLMWARELDYLRKSIHGYFSINSFFLTNTNRDKILEFLNSSNLEDNQQKVLFTIDADPNVIATEPFADISKFNCCTEGNEILFMVGSIFRLVELHDEGDISRIEMQLCGNNEPDLKHVFEYIKKIYGDQDEIDFRIFGDLARRMGKYDLAEMMYHRTIDDLSSNDSLLSDLYCSLGTISKDKGDYGSSLKWYRKSLDMKIRTHSSDFIAIGDLHGCIGEASWRNQNDSKALEHFRKAIELFQKAHAENHPHMADFYNNIGSIYKKQTKYTEALEYFQKALAIDDQCSSSERPNVGKTHNNIGIIYCHLNQYDLAMEHYEKSLSIKLKTLPSEHLSIAKSYKNIAFVYEMKADLQQALTYYQKAEAIYGHLLPSQHPDVIQINNNIENVLRIMI